MPSRRSSADKERYFKLRNDGVSNAEACRAIGIDIKTGNAWTANLKDSSGKSFRERQELLKLTGPLDYEDLSPDGKRAYDDFEFFRRVIFGRLSSPWQIDAAYQFDERIKSDKKEYINLNCPPGSGKSTELHDIEAWLTARRRWIRGLLGSSTQRNSDKYAGRLKRTLERPRPEFVDPAQVAAGRAFDPKYSMSQLFGRFQPDRHDLWRQQEFIVAQLGDVAISEKEPTWQAYGLDSEFVGNRVDISVWDDVVTLRLMRTLEAIEKQRQTWDREAETRIEPGGALFLVGQRLGPSDLYAYCKSKLAGEDIDALEALLDGGDELDEPVEGYVEIDPMGSKVARKYHSIVYPAHDDDRCHGHHSTKNPRYWAPDDPEACLLDPVRLPWSELRSHQLTDMKTYETVYQQKDVAAGSVLVPRHFITGGEVDGEQFPGCYDTQRAYHQVPQSLNYDAYSIVTVDPSPTEWWAVQWWLYDHTSQLRFLMDSYRNKLGADQFLQYNPDAQPELRYTGLLEDLWQLSSRLGRPFKYLIVERNGAQRFLLQYDFVNRWLALRGVSLHPHDTMNNKSDPEYGVQTIASQYKFGRIRLPNKGTKGDMGHAISRLLVDEVTLYPNGTTTDQVMAHWFLEYWIPRIVAPSLDGLPIANRPSWLRRPA